MYKEHNSLNNFKGIGTMKALTKKQITNHINDTDFISYILEDGTCNFSSGYITDKMVLKLQDQNILAYNIFDGIFVSSDFIDRKTGDYNEYAKSLFFY